LAHDQSQYIPLNSTSFTIDFYVAVILFWCCNGVTGCYWIIIVVLI
jgi:hypothetical protein